MQRFTLPPVVTIIQIEHPMCNRIMFYTSDVASLLKHRFSASAIHSLQLLRCHGPSLGVEPAVLSREQTGMPGCRLISLLRPAVLLSLLAVRLSQNAQIPPDHSGAVLISMLRPAMLPAVLLRPRPRQHPIQIIV